MRPKIITILIWIPLLFCAQAYSILNPSVIIQNTAQVGAIGLSIWKTATLTEQLTEINWGVINPGSVKIFTAYVLNEGNTPITVTTTTSAWIPPEAEASITVTGNLTSTPIPSGDSTMITFSLHVDEDIENIINFSFDITVTAHMP